MVQEKLKSSSSKTFPIDPYIFEVSDLIPLQKETQELRTNHIQFHFKCQELITSIHDRCKKEKKM